MDGFARSRAALATQIRVDVAAIFHVTGIDHISAADGGYTLKGRPTLRRSREPGWGPLWMASNCGAPTLAAAAVFLMAMPAWSANPVNSSELTLSAANVPPSPATAGQPVLADAVARARALIREFKFNEALAILRPLTRGERADPGVAFLLGIAAIEASRLPGVAEAERDALLDEAIASLRFMLIDRPELVRVRLELARAFFYKGEDNLSREHFERVLAGEPPPAVAANVQRFLARIRARRGWRMHVGAAIAPDTNIGGTSAKRTLYIWGLPFQRDAEELTTSGVGISAWAGGEYRYPLDDALGLRAGGDISRRDYAGERFDRLFLSGHAGPRWLVDRNTEVSLLASVRRRWTANAPYHDDLGLRARGRAPAHAAGDGERPGGMARPRLPDTQIPGRAGRRLLPGRVLGDSSDPQGRFGGRIRP